MSWAFGLFREEPRDRLLHLRQFGRETRHLYERSFKLCLMLFDRGRYVRTVLPTEEASVRFLHAVDAE